MLKFFCHRSSFMVRLVNALAGIEALWLVLRGPRGFFTGFMIFTWLFFNLLDWISWYPGHPGKLGIRIHFQKNIVPISYLCAIVFGLRLAGMGDGPLAVFSVLMLPVYYVSGMLLYFHFRDRSTLMPSYFSHNFYLREKEPPWSPSPSSDSVLEN